MIRARLPFRLLPTVACLLLFAVLAGCNVLFVPRRPPVTPSPTPNTAVHQYPELEARLPNEIGGKQLEKFSLNSDAEAQSPKTQAVLVRLGKTPADLQFARGSASGVDLSAVALRIVGADAIQAAVAFQSIDEADPQSDSTYEPAVVAGKRVLIRTTGNVIAYIYPLDDVLFVFTGRRPLVEEALTETR